MTKAFASDRFIARQRRYWDTVDVHWTSVTTDVQVVAVGPGIVYVIVGDKATLASWQRRNPGPEGGHYDALAAGIRTAKRHEAAIERFARRST